MARIPRATTWPAGTLRPFESIHSISAKLAIFNHVGVDQYERTVRECRTRALALLLREPLSRVRTVVESPVWLQCLERFIDNSSILGEGSRNDRQHALSLKYCPECAGNFYHSWLHNLSWIDHCFVHQGTRLAVSAREVVRTDAQNLITRLYDRWHVSFGAFLRTPERFDGAFSSLTTRMIMRRARALEVLFDPRDYTPVRDPAQSVTSVFSERREHAPLPLPSAFSSESMRGVGAADALCSTDGRGAGGEGESRRGGKGEEGEGAGNVEGKEEVKAEGGQAEIGSCELKGHRRIGALLSGEAPSRAALIRGVVSTLHGATEPSHMLNRSHRSRQICRGCADFAPGSMAADFWAHLAHTLSTGERGPERALLEDFLERLAIGHEDCLKELEHRYAAGYHFVPEYDEFDDNRYVAYRLRHEKVCPRLVTFDFVACLLRPHFLQHDLARHVLVYRSIQRQVKWVHAGFGPVNILSSPEWRQYVCTHDVRGVFPRKAHSEDFAHHLRALEWALFRKEGLAYELGRIQPAAIEIAKDLQLVVIAVRRDDGGASRTYFDDTETLLPDWGALARRRPSHAGDSFHALKDARIRIRLKPG